MNHRMSTGDRDILGRISPKVELESRADKKRLPCRRTIVPTRGAIEPFPLIPRNACVVNGNGVGTTYVIGDSQDQETQHICCTCHEYQTKQLWEGQCDKNKRHWSSSQKTLKSAVLTKLTFWAANDVVIRKQCQWTRQLAFAYAFFHVLTLLQVRNSTSSSTCKRVEPKRNSATCRRASSYYEHFLFPTNRRVSSFPSTTHSENLGQQRRQSEHSTTAPWPGHKNNSSSVCVLLYNWWSWSFYIQKLGQQQRMKFFRRDDGQRHDSFDPKDLQLFIEKLLWTVGPQLFIANFLWKVEIGAT